MNETFLILKLDSRPKLFLHEINKIFQKEQCVGEESAKTLLNFTKIIAKLGTGSGKLAEKFLYGLIPLAFTAWNNHRSSIAVNLGNQRDMLISTRQNRSRAVLESEGAFDIF